MNLSVMNDEVWRKFCGALERPDLLTDPRFAVRKDRYANDVLIKEIVQAILETEPFDHWSGRLTEAGILHERVNDYLDFLEHPHTAAANAVQWIDHPGIGRVPIPSIPGVEPAMDGDARAWAPHLGQQTDEILSALGYEPDEVDALRDANVITGKG
jgi:crotonobetainyl-CoA:carnitine CoA-transferase CaiB-like acyl-CoA transferase